MITQAKNAPLTLEQAQTCLFNFKENKSSGKAVDLFALKVSKDGLGQTTVVYTNEILYNMRQQYLVDKSSFGMMVLDVKAHNKMTREHTSQSQISDNLFSNFGITPRTTLGCDKKEIFEKAICFFGVKKDKEHGCGYYNPKQNEFINGMNLFEEDEKLFNYPMLNYTEKDGTNNVFIIGGSSKSL